MVRIEDDILLLVHNHKTPSEDEWKHYLAVLNRNLKGQLIVTLGGGPNAAQRREAAKRAKAVFKDNGRQIPLSVVMTDSAPMRGLVTVFNWLFPNRFRAFQLHDFKGALHCLGSSSQQVAFYERCIGEMRAALS